MTNPHAARAVADLEAGLILASVELAAPPELVFDLLASPEVTRWWVRDGVFDTRQWSGDVRVGGAWKASGVGLAGPYVLQGEFVELDRPGKLSQTWKSALEPSTTTFSYALTPTERGTRLTLCHESFQSPRACAATCLGWETSFERRQEIVDT